MKQTRRFLMAIFAAMLPLAVAWADNVAKIGETEYETLADAVSAATAGQTVEVTAAGTYTLPNLSQNITIKGDVDGVVFSHTGSGSIASIPNGATFENVSFELGNNNYHGFQHAGTINMTGCTLNGKLFSYGDMNFTNCQFNQSSADYHMWCYSGNITYTGCTFTNSVSGKFLNIYNEDGSTKYSVTATNCSFINNGSSSKAALNVKSTCGSKLLAFDVVVNNCTTEGAFPAASSSSSLIVFNSLIQVDDRPSSGTDNIKVTQDGTVLYENGEVPAPAVAKIGETSYSSLQEALDAAEETNTANIVVDLLADAELTIAAWSGTTNKYAIGVANTESITINGNGHQLTFMTTDTDWNNVATYSDNTVLKLNNMTIDQGGKNTKGTWNSYDINFNCAVELNNVTSNRPLAFKNDATVNDVTINVDSSKDVYGMWIQTNGQSVAIDGLTMNVPSGRAIAVKDQYVNDAPATTTALSITNATFTTAKKAAILVTAKYGAEITASNLDITNVAADSENAVWVDEDLVNKYGEITFNSEDETMVPEGGVAAYEAALATNGKVDGYYKTLAAAITAAEAGQSVVLLQDIDLGAESLSINKALTIDGGGQYGITSKAAQTVLLTGEGAVSFKDVRIVASAGHGIQAGDDNAAYSGQLTLNGATLTVAKRGIRVYSEDTGFGIALDGSTIQSNVADPTTTYTTGNDAMALSLGTTDGKGYTVTINNSELKGFSYDINAVTSGSNLNVTMTGGKTYGRAALNVWGSNNTFTLDGVEVHGLNNQTGPTEAFACIVENSGATGNTYNINGVTFIANLSEAAMNTNGSSATQQMVDLRGTGATMKITGNTTYTCNSEERGGLFYNEGALETSTVLMDATAMNNLGQLIKKATVASEADENGLYAVTYVSEVYYYWIANGVEDGGYYDFAQPFVKGWLADGEFIRLKKDITLTDNIACQIESGSFTLTFGDYTITKGDYSVSLKNGVSVLTDKQTDIFSAAEEGYKIVETATGSGYTYSVAELESTDMDIVLKDDNTSTVEPYTITEDTPVKSVSYSRLFEEKRVGNFQSWFVPFDYTISAEDAEAFSFYKIKMIANSADPGESENVDDTKLWIFLEKVEPNTTLKANRPYVIKPNAECEYVFKVDNAILKAKQTDPVLQTETTENTYKFYGTYDGVTASADDIYYYVSAKGNISWTQKLTCPPYRWIVRVTGKDLDYSRTFGFIVDGEGTTAIGSVANESTTTVYYTLDGVRVQHPGKGIYLMKTANGVKKVSLK